MFNCAAFSFAEEEIVILDEPTEILTFDDFVIEDGEELFLEQETEVLVEPERAESAVMFEEPDVLTAQTRLETGINPEPMWEEKLLEAENLSEYETALPEFQELTLRVGVNGASYTTGFVYNDSFLLKDNTTMWPDLAKASIALASSAYVTVGQSPNSLYSALEEMGYTVDKTCGNWNRKHTVDDNDFVRYVIASKPIVDGDVERIIYCLIIQGTRGGFDWDSDFNIGTGDDHCGFYTAREEIMDKLCQKMASDGLSSPSQRILWTTGHSRGAAVSNIIAGEFTTGHSEGAPISMLSALIHDDRVFSYNFACPAVSKRAEVRQAHMNDLCPNIFNFNSPDDVIPTVPTEDWGYVRYGIDVPLPAATGSINFKNRFHVEKGTTYDGTVKTVTYLTDIINRGVPNSTTANAPIRQAIMKVIALAMKDEITLKIVMETLHFYVKDNGDKIIQQYAENYILSESGLDEPLSYVETIDQLSIKSTKYLRETENLSQEEFSVWLNDNRDEVEELELWSHHQIGSRKDLEDVWALFGANSLAEIADFSWIDAGEAEALLECGIGLYAYFTDDGSFDAIGDGHDWMSYLLFINEKYYGYKGWYHYENSFGVNPDMTDKVFTIGQSCFEGSGIGALYANSQLKYIGSSACSSAANLREADLGEELEGLGDNAFYNCTALEKLRIPAGCPLKSHTVFSRCESLSEIHYSGYGEMSEHIVETQTHYDYNTHRYYYVVPWAYCISPVTVVIEDGVTTVSDNAFCESDIEQNGHYYLRESLEPCAKLESISIGRGVTSVGDSAFEGCSGLTETLTIPNSVTFIGDSAFKGCSGLTGALTIPNSVTFIGDKAFYGCSGLTGALMIPGSVTSIGAWAFEGCSGLTGTLTIPGSVTSIGDGAFKECSGLTGALTIPGSVTSIGDGVFEGCSGLTGALTIPDSVTSIGYNAFYDCSGLTGALTIPNSVTSIGSYAFYGCSGLTGALTIPDSVTSIGGYAFYDCSGLTGALTIPSSITFIGDLAFYDCSGLTVLSMPAQLKCKLHAFIGCDNVTTVHLTGTGSMADYRSHPDSLKDMTAPWDYFGKLTVVIDEGVTSISPYAFYECSNLVHITIPNSVTSIGESAFYDCYRLTGVLTIPNSVTSIGESAFYGCSGLMGALTIPNSVTSIGNGVFYGCSGLTSVTIPNSMTSIGNGAFANCSDLTDVYYNGTEEQWLAISIGSDNDPLTNASIHYIMPDFILPAALMEIGEEAFAGGMFSSVYIPASVTTIADNAFGNTQNLTILGNAGSTAEAYAEAHGFDFVPAA